MFLVKAEIHNKIAPRRGLDLLKFDIKKVDEVGQIITVQDREINVSSVNPLSERTIVNLLVLQPRGTEQEKGI